MRQVYISATELRQNLFEIIRKITTDGSEYIVLKRKKPVLRISQYKPNDKEREVNPLQFLKPIFKLGRKISKEEAQKEFREAKEYHYKKIRL